VIYPFGPSRYDLAALAISESVLSMQPQSITSEKISDYFGKAASGSNYEFQLGHQVSFSVLWKTESSI
jgi:hypothetical protein|tara:strand:+ start:474 stop:677 length:204 start_codon:yes stop_codon:yes gene_type:complete